MEVAVKTTWFPGLGRRSHSTWQCLEMQSDPRLLACVGGHQVVLAA